MLDQHTTSLLSYLQTIPDPRRRQGRRYPLPALLGVLVLGAVHGQSSLRGIWLWAKQHWARLWQPLGFYTPTFPALTTLWNAVARLEPGTLERVMRHWCGHQVDATSLSADGKVLRGSRRDTTPGIQLVALVEHTHGLVLGQERVTDGEGELGALWRLLQQVSLHGRTVTADAGLLQSGITRVVTQRDGFYLGVLKDNQREVKAAVEVWLQEQGLALAYEQRRQADTVTQETSRGRQEERSLWLVPAGDLHPYLAREWGWWNVQQVGILRRRQQRRPTQPWQVQEVIVITSLDAHAASAGRILDLLRCHWIIENRVHYVRDVSYGEDRLHARKTGQVLAWARNIAINLLRSKDFRYIPDGWRFASAHPRTVVRWLTE